jgi:hypothetical protein
MFCCGKIWGALWLAKELLTFEGGHSSLEVVNITYHFLPLIQHIYVGMPLSSYSLYNKWANRRCQTILATQNNVPIWRCPCIVIYSYSTTNNMHLLPQIIYSCKMLYMFLMVFPSIIRSSILRIQQCIMSNSCCYQLLSGMRWNSILSPIAGGSISCLTYTVAVYAVLSSWWWMERPSETCRAFYKNK